MTPAVEGVLSDTGMKLSDIDAVAVTYGPGLAGALLVGVSFAKGLASGLGIPFLGVNHLEGHLWSAELTTGQLPLPLLGLIISGGHTLMIRVEGFGRYVRLGGTRDDAVGELFDKVGRMLGFSFPAGADLDNIVLNFTGKSVHFPRAKLSDDPFGFSFSGLKTAVLYYLKKRYTSSHKKQTTDFNIPPEERAAITAGLMESVGDMLIKGLSVAFDTYDYRGLVVAGGVSASQFLRKRFTQFAEEHRIPLFIPPPHHCTDNGSMIAYAGWRRLQRGYTSSLDLSIDPAASLFNSDSIKCTASI
ncbi:MAG: tRNA (adenosine(37)-N6)-threonylcarbamoyltransferase complex transferase subunit TsaD [Candidatus Electryoneaceae bacterium]|nr:tRNA (adenosine(37)-N6)-threonylcarbamoyltransferase complex transferase subunit TsaD [Candidatus Electryoneaceae bacterium]